SGTLYRTFQRKKLSYLPRIPDNLPFDDTDEAIRQQLKLTWFVHFPLIIRGEVIGLLACTNYKKTLHLNRKDLQYIQTVVDQIAGAVNGSFLYEQAQSEKERADGLLRNILPVAVANELQTTGHVASRIHTSSTIAFTDFCGFTIASRSMTAHELIQELDDYFYQFDEVMRRHNLTKLKTIGDAYMFAGGIPNDNRTHIVDCCLAALEIQAIMNQARQIKEDLGILSWKLRIGIHTGTVASGIIGKDRFA
ncbi:MAG: GAF domain-containing protein, partial [Leptonema sp. (in: Bacteria)]|nr:GAF domain-containing protein [Leptonema sp. (in: bacteria)]